MRNAALQQMLPFAPDEHSTGMDDAASEKKNRTSVLVFPLPYAVDGDDDYHH